MPSLSSFLTFEYANEYETEYDLSKKKNYSEPKIYDAKGDLSKRWYVYFSCRNPESGKMERQNPLYANANSYATRGERLEVLSMLRRSLSDFLKKGYNPYTSNQLEALAPKPKDFINAYIEKILWCMPNTWKKMINRNTLLCFNNTKKEYMIS